MSDKILSKCGMRCDLCLIYRPNVEKEDNREKICAVYKKIFDGYGPDPKTIICDGCLCTDENAIRLEQNCKTRKCVFDKGIEHCGYCNDYPCEIFPAEPSYEEIAHNVEVLKKWTWDEEKLMEAYQCKKNIDDFVKLHRQN